MQGLECEAFERLFSLQQAVPGEPGPKSKGGRAVVCGRDSVASLHVSCSVSAVRRGRGKPDAICLWLLAWISQVLGLFRVNPNIAGYFNVQPGS